MCLRVRTTVVYLQINILPPHCPVYMGYAVCICRTPGDVAELFDASSQKNLRSGTKRATTDANDSKPRSGHIDPKVFEQPNRNERFAPTIAICPPKRLHIYINTRATTTMFSDVCKQGMDVSKRLTDTTKRPSITSMEGMIWNGT